MNTYRFLIYERESYMKIQIIQIKENDINTIVTGITEAGIIKGIWNYNEKPIIGKEYYVELDIDKINANDIEIFQGKEYEVSLIKDELIFKVKCDSIDTDSVYSFRLGKSIFLIEIANDKHIINLNDFVTFKIDYNHIRIFPYEY